MTLLIQSLVKGTRLSSLEWTNDFLPGTGEASPLSRHMTCLLAEQYWGSINKEKEGERLIGTQPMVSQLFPKLIMTPCSSYECSHPATFYVPPCSYVFSEVHCF